MSPTEIETHTAILTARCDTRWVEMWNHGVQAKDELRTVDEQHEELWDESSPVRIRWEEFVNERDRDAIQESAIQLLSINPRTVIDVLLAALSTLIQRHDFTDHIGQPSYNYAFCQFIQTHAANVSTWLLALNLHIDLAPKWRHKIISAISKNDRNRRKEIVEAQSILRALYTQPMCKGHVDKSVRTPGSENSTLKPVKSRLIGKEAILVHLDVPNDRWRYVLRLSKVNKGPIESKKGAKSYSDRDALTRWWNEVLERKKTVPEAPLTIVPYGRSGHFVPDIRGNVKKRKVRKASKT